ncbi:general secretion pathway protein L [Sphingobium sp. B2D3A]|uniref:type II secretion system protein GspL n=1 Tax=unclassified Sphingobium TaxID=2611147 RepID=UPI0022240570|nr:MULTISPECIES: type II secretion system protein GspL [unclassified Sphingobium]MCW2338745.1 general secretion pathway protein L [Sphingobium sp. B2D3A]MCW2349786.1 general secretion pathway protein L [Sphingobium sp. B12D2B]MCW2385203.1 general secretion pathway protein L [Sphingobium sp. B2D3D]
MKHDYVIVLPRESDTPPVWYRVADEQIVRRGRGTEWFPPEQANETEPAVGHAMLVLPPHVTTLHFIACPGMTPKQGAAAARLMALEASIGDGDQLHAAVAANDDPDAPHVVAVTSRSAMTHWVDWAAEHGIAQASLVPSALLLPAPEDGFVHAPIGGADVVRGRDSAFDGSEPHAPLIIGEASLTRLPPDNVDEALLLALATPPLDLRQGAFARRAPALFGKDRWRRMAIMLGLILLASLIVSLITIVRLNAEASRLDAQTVAIAQSVDPAVSDAAGAEARVTALLGARGGRGGFTGTVAGLMSAMQVNANVTLTSINQGSDGALRVQLSANQAEEINEVLIAIQEAGWRISANAVQQRGARIVADITVVR